MITYLRDTEPGELIEVGLDCYGNIYYEYNECKSFLTGEVIGKYNSSGERCFAWNGRKNNNACSRDLIDRYSGTEFNVIPAYIKNMPYEWFKWFMGNFTVKVIEAIISPDQVCIGCNLPSPHVKPNLDNKFQCVSCKVLETL